jgi:hypothetical protein
MTPRSSLLLALLLLPTGLRAQADLKVNEVSTGTISWIEIANLGSVTEDLSLYKIRFGGNSGTNFIQGVYTIPAGTMLGPNQTLVITEDPTTVTPTVPAGVFKAYTGAGIVWTATPAIGANGVVALNNSFDFGVDRMKWGNPINDFSSYGSFWTGSINPGGAVMYRNSPFDTDSPSDWGATAVSSATPGLTNPGEALVIDLEMTTTGAGDITIDVITFGPAVPNGEIFNLFSLIDLTPDGSGPLFGIAADALLQATTPVGAGNPFHTNLDGTGHWQIAVPPGFLPIGLHVEGVSLLIQGLVTRISTVEVITL